MKTVNYAIKQLAENFQLPIGLEKLNFYNTSDKPVIERDLDNGYFIRESMEGLPKLVLELTRMKQGYTVAINSIPNKDMYDYKTSNPLKRNEIVKEVFNYLKSIELDK